MQGAAYHNPVDRPRRLRDYHRLRYTDRLFPFRFSFRIAEGCPLRVGVRPPFLRFASRLARTAVARFRLRHRDNAPVSSAGWLGTGDKLHTRRDRAWSTRGFRGTVVAARRHLPSCARS